MYAKGIRKSSDATYKRADISQQHPGTDRELTGNDGAADLREVRIDVNNSEALAEPRDVRGSSERVVDASLALPDHEADVLGLVESLGGGDEVLERERREREERERGRRI